MVIYFSNRYNEVIAVASDEHGSLIIADKFDDEVSTGVKSVEIAFQWTESIERAAQCGNFLMLGGSNTVLYQITDVSKDANEQLISVYAEDAGIELLSKVQGAWKADKDQTLLSAVKTVVGDLDWNIESTVTKKTKGKAKFDFQEQTALERLQEIVKIFNAEMYFTYTIDGLSWIKRTINFTPKRGEPVPVYTFRLGEDISDIIEQHNIDDLATVYVCKGKGGKALSKLSNYSKYKGKTIKPADNYADLPAGRKYTYYVTGNEVRATDAMQNWTSKLDKDGRLARRKTTNDTDAADLIAAAIKDLEKNAAVKTTYEVSFTYVPEDIQAGDQVRIVDEGNNLYLQSRITKIDRSYVSKTCSIDLSDFVELVGSKATAQTFENTYTLTITSTAWATSGSGISTTLAVSLWQDGQIITGADQLDAGQRLQWYVNDIAVSAEDSRIINNGFNFVVSGQTGSSTYTCELLSEEATA